MDMGQKNISRLYHIDFLRSFMLFLGVAVHASHIDGGSGDLKIVRDVSDLFRMACFFMLSGYFTSLVFEKNDSEVFFKKRIVALAVPAVFCVSLLVPITNEKMQSFFILSGNSESFKSSWMGHAWFLFSLLFFTLTFNIFEKIALFITNAYYSSSSNGNLKLVASFCFFIFCFIFLNKTVNFILSQFSVIPQKWLAIATIYYAPFYLFGVVLFKLPSVFRAINTKVVSSLILTMTALLIYYFLRSVSFETKMLNFAYYNLMIPIAKYFLAFSISFFLIAVSYRIFGRKNEMVLSAAKASYTVYIFHYVIISILISSLYNIEISLIFKFMLLSSLTAIVAVFIHFSIVGRFSIVEFLVNGKTKARNGKKIGKSY